MKKRLLFITLFTPFIAAAQSWDIVGAAGFSDSTASYTAMAIDTSGMPYVVYRDAGHGNKATVMQYNGTSWANTGSAGFSAGPVYYTSIAANSAGMPYVVYSDSLNNNKATVMMYNGTSWATVGSAGFSDSFAYYTAIAIGKNDTPYVVYSDGDAMGEGRATVMKYNGSSWVTVGAPKFSAGTAEYTSIAIDSSGTPYVVYEDFGHGERGTVMKYNGSAWATVGDSTCSLWPVAYTTIAIGPGGVPYVGYEDFGYSSRATVVRYADTGWVSVGAAGFSAGEANGTSIAINSGGVPYLAYMDYTAGYKATVMSYTGAAWVAAGNPAFSDSTAVGTMIAIAKNGTAYVAYQDYGNNEKATVMRLDAAIMGIDEVCAGSTTTLSDTTSGGIWSSSNTGVATVGSTGIVSGVVAGTATISYTVGTNVSTQVMTVNASPDGIDGSEWFYPSVSPYYLTLTDSTPGGVWSSSNTAYAIIGSATGVVTAPIGFAGGPDTSTIMYTLPGGCSVSFFLIVYAEGIPTIPNTNEITIFPNPATSSLTIQSSKEAITQISITNLLGQVVAGKQSTAGLQVDMDVSALPTGIYFVQVNSAYRQAGGGEVKKFVKE